MLVRDTIYIDGSWVASSGTGAIDVVNPATEEVIATVPEGTPEDVDRAVAAARSALPTWSRTPGDERGKLLQRISELMEGRAQEIGALISSEMGMPVRQAVMIQAGLPIRTFASQAKLLETYEFEEPMGSTLIVREPVGVVGAITPWNYPLHQIALKVAAALAAGCTVVLKPSEVAPLNAFLLAEIIDEVGFPPGAFNLVSGTGPVVGRGDGRPPRHRHDLVHRVDPSRTPGPRAGLDHHQAGRPRARGQVAQRHLRGHRLRRGGHFRGRGGLRELRADLHRPHPDDRAPLQAGRGRGGRQGRGRDLQGRRPSRRGDPARAARLGHPARAGPRLHPEGDRRGGQAADRWCRPTRRERRRATTSGPRCSPMSAAT